MKNGKRNGGCGSMRRWQCSDSGPETLADLTEDKLKSIHTTTHNIDKSSSDNVGHEAVGRIASVLGTPISAKLHHSGRRNEPVLELCVGRIYN